MAGYFRDTLLTRLGRLIRDIRRKTDGHLGRNFLHGRTGDQINAVMSAVGYNLRLILKWLRILWRQIIAAIAPFSTLKQAS